MNGLRRLFGDPLNAALSLGVLAAAAALLPALVRWGLLEAVFQPDTAACEAASAGLAAAIPGSNTARIRRK